jgi:GTP:adenosylcobinamide-phosphate guanylyltransferase
MQTPGHAVIAAAGLGSRLGHGKPKCLVEVAGRRILDHQLDLLRDVPDVRLVVGYLEHEVIDLALRLRSDITIVRNPAYRTTTTQQSYWLGARHLPGPCLYLDGDIVFEPDSVHAFLAEARGNTPMLAVTEAKTEQAVFVDSQPGEHGPFLAIRGFSRTARSRWEWANLAFLPAGTLEENGGNVFERLARFLPMKAMEIVACEVDTEGDLSQAEAFVAQMLTGQLAVPALRVA